MQHCAASWARRRAELPKTAHRKAGRRHAGFTLAELLVTIAIVAIATAIGVPMLRGFVDDAGVATTADQMISALNYTRSEAVKRNTRVTMCRSSDGAACAAAATPGDWRAGWIIYVDGGNAGSIDAGDTVLRVQGALSGSARLLGSGGVSDYVSYTSSGQPRLADGAPQAGVFSACGAASGTARRKIALAQGTGWVGVERAAASASCTS